MKFTRVRINNFYNLKDVDLDLTQGQALIVGPNGSGKSNIIKCVEFLVNRILGYHPESGTIWNVNAPDAYIEVRAVFSREELEFFSNLRVFYLLCDVSEIICFICAVVKSLVTSTPFQTQSTFASAEELADELREQIATLGDFPRETLTSLFEGDVFGRRNGQGSFVIESQYRGQVDRRSACIELLISKTIEKLFPTLLKKTQEAVASEQTRPADRRSDVLMSVHRAKRGIQQLDSRHLILNDVWLPTSTETERAAIQTCLREIFGELRGIQFSQVVQRQTTQFTSLEGVIRAFVIPQPFDVPTVRYGGIDMYVQADLFHGNSPDAVKKLPDVMKWLSSWLQGQQVESIEVDRIPVVDRMSREFLRSSLCILPQHRGRSCQGSTVSLDLGRVENMLIQTSLSSDDYVQTQYKSVIDKFKSFCGLDIHIREKPLSKSWEEHGKTIENLGSSLRGRGNFQPEDVAETLKELAERVLSESRSVTSRLQVLVTRTMHSEKSPYSITTPLSGLSGGEIELLMVFCAVHLSDAENVFLDEPGHSLHPPQQGQLSRWLTTQRPTSQVCVVISHSTEFISRQTVTSLYHMSFVGDGFKPFKLHVQGRDSGAPGAGPATDQSTEPEASKTNQAQEPNSAQISTRQVTIAQDLVTMLMRPHMRKMFFATGLYFVEGPTDHMVLTAIRHCMMEDASKASEAIIEMKEGDDFLQKMKQARRVMRVRKMDQWDVIDVGGCGEAVKAYKMAKQLKIPCAVILDADAITVKHKKELKPLVPETWRESVLYKQLSKLAASLQDAKDLLSNIKTAFDESKSIREELEKYGFWVWDDDLESAVLHTAQTRKILHETIFSLPSRGSDRTGDNLLEEVDAPGSEQANTAKRKSSNPGLQFRKKQKTINSGSTATTISPEKMKKELHDNKGWRKIPWEDLLRAVRACLEHQGSPLARFYEYICTWQSKGKKREQHVPQGLLNIVLPDEAEWK